MRLLKADEVAEALQVPKPRVYELARQRTLPAVRIGRQIRFRQEAIDTWLAMLEDQRSTAPGGGLKPRSAI
jgi:excisionase family DNA binding protein